MYVVASQSTRICQGCYHRCGIHRMHFISRQSFNYLQEVVPKALVGSNPRLHIQCHPIPRKRTNDRWIMICMFTFCFCFPDNVINQSNNFEVLPKKPPFFGKNGGHPSVTICSKLKKLDLCE